MIVLIVLKSNIKHFTLGFSFGGKIIPCLMWVFVIEILQTILHIPSLGYEREEEHQSRIFFYSLDR